MRFVNSHNRFSIPAAFFIAAVATNVSAEPVSDKVLSRVRVSETEACATVTISFNFTIRMESYFPTDRGDHVRVNLKPIEVGRVNGAARSREELRPPASEIAGIQEIQYDGDVPTGPVLTITFIRNRHFDVEQGADFSSVVVRVADAPIAEACASSKKSLRTGPDAGMPAKRGDTASILLNEPDSIDSNAVYALNLLSQTAAINGAALADVPAMEKYAAYTVRYEENGHIWNRLRLGFFRTRTEAQKIKDELAAVYPESWIVRTNDQEREAVQRAWLSRQPAKAEPSVKPPEASPLAAPPGEIPAEQATAAKLVEDAKTEITVGNLPRAIQLLTKALTLPESASTPEARELLGVAREKNGQLAHAKAEYEEYLRLYPDGEGAARVRQRLSALVSAGREPPPALREGSASKNWVARLTGSLSEYYQRDESTVTLEQPNLVPDPDKQVNRNALVSGADITASVSNDRFDASLRFSGSHTKDFTPGAKGTYASISALFVEFADNVSKFFARIGRQSRNTGGVLGRFDGAHVSYDAGDNIRINVVGGAPVIRSRDLFVDRDRRFVGGSVDVGGIFKGFDTSIYFIDQRVDDLVDRRAAGIEMRYVDDRRSAYGLIDYDVFYDSLNMALFNGSWRLKDDTTFNVAFDYRYAPTLMTTDALQGQGVETIDDLRTLLGFSDNEIYYLAEERAARMISGTFSASKQLSKKWQVNGGVTFTNVAPTNDAGGVLGQPGAGVESYYSAQVLANGLFTDGDLASLGFRYDDTSSATRYVIDLNTRHPVTSRFRINPRLRLSQRESKTADQTEFTVKPSIRMNYIPSRRYQFELEGGGEWTRTNNVVDVETLKGYYLIAGVRLDF